MQPNVTRHRVFVNNAIYYGYKRNDKLHVEIILIKEGRTTKTAIWFKTDDPKVPKFVIPGDAPEQSINMEYELVVQEDKLAGVLFNANKELVDVVDIRTDWYNSY